MVSLYLLFNVFSKNYNLKRAACIIALLGWQYCFVLKPLHDIESKNTTVTEQTATDETRLSETTQTDNDIKTDQEKEYPDIMTVDMNTTSAGNKIKIDGIGFDGENIIVQELIETDYENRYIYMNIKSGSESQTISLPKIQFITLDDFGSSCDVCYNNDYIFLLMRGNLWSISMKNHNIIANIGGFHGVMDLSGESECLGVDTSGNVYMLTNSNYSSVDDPGYHLLKYTPELELISDNLTLNEIPFKHIINFDDMYIDENNILCCKYNDNQTVRVDLSDGNVLSDNILIDDDYWYIKDDNDNTPLKMYSPDPSKRYGSGIKNCIDSIVTLSAEGENNISFAKINNNGEFIERYSLPTDLTTSNSFDFNSGGNIVLPVQKVDPLEKFEILTYNIDGTGYTTNTFDFDALKPSLEARYLYYCRMVGFMADNDYYFMNQDTIDEDNNCSYKIYKCTPGNNSETFINFNNNFFNNKFKKLVLLNNKPCINFSRGCNYYCCDLDFENGTYSEPYKVPGFLYPQRDGTVLYIADSALYSYPDNTKIFDIPENLLPEDYEEPSSASNVFITKIDDSRYVYVNNDYTANVHFLTKK